MKTTVLMNCLFIDQSTTRLGWCFSYEDGNIDSGSVRFKGNVYERIEQFIEVIEYLASELKKENSAIYYEGGTTMGGLKGKGQKRAANVMEFEIEKLGHHLNIPVETIHNQTLKTNIMHMAKLEKKSDRGKTPIREALRVLQEPTEIDLMDEDELDARAMAVLYINNVHKSLKGKKK